MWLRGLPKFTIVVLVILHMIVLAAGFFAPYDPRAQHRSFAYAPPMRLHLIDEQHNIHLRPFVYRWSLAPQTFNTYREDKTAIVPVRFFVRGGSYRLLGILDSERHLFGADGQETIFLAGTDAYGRDECSRVLYGGQISLFAALAATSVSLSLGLCLGGLAGYYGGWFDEVVMRCAEVFLTAPWLYLLLAVRALLPMHVTGDRIFLLLAGIMGIIGWARPARLIRGVVLTAKQRDFVLAARGFGASDFYILRKHILPYASGIASTQAALYVPQYVLAEVTLSFFGLGVSEPTPSWGNMLAVLQQPFVLETCWWLFAPALLLALVLLGYQRLFSKYAQNSIRF